MFTRTGVAASCAGALSLAAGYYAADPQNVLFATQAEAHIKEFATSDFTRTPPSPDGRFRAPVPRGADHLFATPGKGPRADRYVAVMQTSTMTKVKLAALDPGDGDITGSLPRDALDRQRVNRVPKADRVIPPLKTLAGLPQPLDTRPSATLFLASLLSPGAYAFPGAEREADDRANPDAPVKMPRSLPFKGETEDEYQARQRRCLATAIYFEARGEPVRGQLAVAQVVMNRVRSSLYPDTICGVVFQGQWQRNACQFSFACDGVPDVPRDKEKWVIANKLAKEVTDGKVWLPEIGHATHYHANYVRPVWRRQLDYVKQLGRHIFYRVRGEQIEDVLTPGENREPSLALTKSG